MKVFAPLLLVSFSVAAWAGGDDIPLNENEFVERMTAADKAEIVAKLGEPARAIDIKDDETGEVMGSIWHYHNLNTAENGDYYKTTELDFVGDQVVTVVFSTSEETGSEASTATEPEVTQQ